MLKKIYKTLKSNKKIKKTEKVLKKEAIRWRRPAPNIFICTQGPCQTSAPAEASLESETEVTAQIFEIGPRVLLPPVPGPAHLTPGPPPGAVSGREGQTSAPTPNIV